jgi:23S rRNA maturation-related 3'-5' exoribonuclease YhaM
LAPRSSGLLLPGPNHKSLEQQHQKIFAQGVRQQISNSGTLSGEILNRLWSDPRKRDRVYGELYALLVTNQVIVLQATEEASAAQPDAGFGVIQTSTEHHHDSLEGLEEEVVKVREDIRRLYDGRHP